MTLLQALPFLAALIATTFALAGVAVKLLRRSVRAAPAADLPNEQRLILDACQRIEAGIRELRTVQPPAPASVIDPGSAMARRARILRMARQGDPPDRIAATLAVPVSEVILVLKVSQAHPAPVTVTAAAASS
ncbi:MAG: hypothetical protein FJW39_05970 [Acidobacteria bacterium]|nr:hypothetical protein [Acidobacteriota bacterium]